ncbi:MAG TPA: DUF433 domain-containing protein [Armatimonadota bacterium]|jgi:uncharacterized protein (DUF433 family)
MVDVAAPHIRIDEHGVAYVGPTRSKVKMVVMDMQSGMDADAIHDAYPHLSLAEIYAAFSYYYDHKDAIDAEIARSTAEVDALQAAAPPSPFVERMRSEGRLR